MKIDLHVHSMYSHDGMEFVRRIIDTARARGLDGIAICDHDVFVAYNEAKSLAPEGFVVIPGVEYSTDAGHVLALFVTRGYELKRDLRGLCRLSDLCAAAKADGAMLVAAHPFRRRAELPEALIPSVAGVEVENSRDALKVPANSAKARAVAAMYGKVLTGGSDAHILREIGSRYTILPDDTPRTVQGVRAAIEAGKSDGAGDGGHLRDQALSKLRISMPRTFLKDLARFVLYSVRGAKNGV